MGVQTQLADKRSDNLELGILQFDSGGPMVYFKLSIVFQAFRRIPSFSKGVELFSGMGVNMLISIETYRTYDFTGGGGGTYPTSGSTHALIFSV